MPTHFGVSLCLEASECSIAMLKGLHRAYYEFSIIITVTNKSLSFQFQKENMF